MSESDGGAPALSQQLVDAVGTPALLLPALAAARAGDYARARAALDRSLARRPVYELVELVAALIGYVTRDYDQALASLAAVAEAHRYLAAPALRELQVRATRLGWAIEAGAAEERLRALGVRDLRGRLRTLQRERQALAERGPLASLWAGLEHQPRQLGEALAGRLAQGSAPGDAAVLVGLRARLHLRLGELDDAAALLGPELDGEALGERWALALARGRAEELLAAPLPATAGARLLALRSEAALACDRLADAAALLARVDRADPSFAGVSALLRVLVDARREPDAAPPIDRFVALYQLVPGLLADAARVAGEPLWIDGGPNPDARVWLRCCERAQASRTADRVAPAWYRTRDGQGRERLRGSPAPAVAALVHGHDGDDLDQAARLLDRMLAKARARQPSKPADARPGTRGLAAADVEGFLADGYVHLRGAFPRSLAAEIVAGAHRRLREDPGRWLGGTLDPQQLAALRRYDPDDPQTWPRGRVDLLGERRFEIREFSPRAAAAIVELLGDPARIETRVWSDSLIINFPGGAPVEGSMPDPRQQSWHLDSPSPATRLDRLTTGLLVLVLFGDLEPDSGNTWLALDSPARVARALAGEPEGVDFCDLATAPSITRTCTRFFEVTGEAGDILLLHPLMLHSASPNPSPRIRWLGNPMVYLTEPLDHRRSDPSLVERLIADALA